MHFKTNVLNVLSTVSLLSCISSRTIHVFYLSLILLKPNGPDKPVDPAMIRGLRAKMIQPTICKHSARKLANSINPSETLRAVKWQQVNQAYEGARCGMSSSAVSYSSVSWIQANMTWEGGITTMS